MGLVGTISVMLLHELFVVRPALASAAEPTRIVVGSSTRRSVPESGILAEAG
jgi:hypothetical protein